MTVGISVEFINYRAYATPQTNVISKSMNYTEPVGSSNAASSMLEVASSNNGRDTEYTDWTSRFFSLPASKFRNVILKKATAASLQILST
jgi:hypothetical protein